MIERDKSGQCIWVLLENWRLLNYFNNKGSDVFVAFMDCTKAFDRLSHFGLFIKLIERGIPLCLLLIIIFWHLNMKGRVKWGNSYSEPFIIPLGTKQGGISSPGYFSLYVNDLILLLRKSGVGCHLIKWFIGCILFADDITLISLTRAGLQRMMDICVAYCNKFCLQFNPKKSKCMVFGKDYKAHVAPLVMNGSPIEFVVEWKYLGTTLVSYKELSFSARPDLASFFSSREFCDACT